MSLDNYSKITLYGKVIAIKKKLYTTVIIEDINKSNDSDYKFVTTTILPNWNISVSLGSIGFFEMQITIAGVSTWYNNETKDCKAHNYSAYYLLSFIEKQEQIKKEYQL